MNLADIRKKAQQEKSDTGLRDVEKTDRPAGEPQAQLERQVQFDLQHASAPFDLRDRKEEAQANPPPVRPDTPQSFDPIAMLLAGRVAAGCDLKVSADESAIEAADDDFREFLCFRVADEFYAISIMEIKEIIKPREITEVPRVPAFISGVLSLRGIIIPVFNMHERLGLEGNRHTGKERIVVVKKGEEFSGVLVDEVIQVVRIRETAIEQPPVVLEGIDRDFVQGIGRHDGRMLILLNLSNILDLTLY